MPFTVAQIAHQLNGQVIGDGSVAINGLAPADHARPGELTFAENAKYFAAAEQSQAAAILVSEPFVSAGKVLIRVPNARIALARALPPCVGSMDQSQDQAHSARTSSFSRRKGMSPRKPAT